MSWELLAIIAFVVIAILGFLFRKNPIVKKYWKYGLILIPAVLVIIMRMINNKNNANREEDIEESAGALQDAVSSIKEDLNEASMTAAIEVTAAKTKDEVKVKELQEVVRIKDKRERRKRLAGMIG